MGAMNTICMTSITQPIVTIVDDDPRLLESLESLIQSAGLKARVFSLAEDFLSGDDLSSTSCLVTDIRMTGMNGLDLQRRARVKRPQLPVIFITAHHDEGVEQEAFEEGAAFFFYKPFDADKLLRAIKLVLTKPIDINERAF
jgi:FixJ family two-component response regulator